MKEHLIRYGALWLGLMGLVLLFPEQLANPGPLSRGHAKLERDCFACHTPLLGPGDGRCLACHPLEKIDRNKPGLAFHTRLREAPCGDCHSDHQGREPARNTHAFRHDLLTPQELAQCSACHQGPKDTIHQENSRTPCQQCHGVAGWSPARFNHDRWFRFDRHHPPRCADCHDNRDYRSYTCYNCHEHSRMGIAFEHLEEGIRDFERCHDCHRSGDEHEAEWRMYQRSLGRDPDASPPPPRRERRHHDDD